MKTLLFCLLSTLACPVIYIYAMEKESNITWPEYNTSWDDKKSETYKFFDTKFIANPTTTEKFLIPSGTIPRSLLR